MKKESLRDIGRALYETAAERASGPVDRLEEALFPEPSVVWSERGWEGMVERLTEIRESMERKQELGEELELSEEEQQDLSFIVHSIAEAMKSVTAALRSMAEHFSEWIGDLVRMDIWAELVNVSMAIGEPEQQVETIDIVTKDGTVLATHDITPNPLAASGHVAILPDEEQASYIDPDGSPLSQVNLQPNMVQGLLDHRTPTDIAVQRALRQPFTEPFKIDLEGR